MDFGHHGGRDTPNEGFDNNNADVNISVERISSRGEDKEGEGEDVK